MILENWGIRRGSLLVPPAVLACVFWWHIGGSTLGPPDAMAQGMEAAAPSTRLVLSFNFYGSTPSLSWSPDGRRLAFNAAYEYYGYDHLISAQASQLGIWVYERDTETARQLLNEQRYHPAWLGNDVVASGCSPYEDCVEGLYLTALWGGNNHALTSSVYNTHAANDHQVLFYEGFRGYTRWNRFDAATTARETELSANCSWEPPPELFQDQCVQQVGDVSVAVDATTGLWVRYGEAAAIRVDETTPFSFSAGAWDCAESHNGPVPACLSPDARQVAYVAGIAGGMVLRVHELPAIAEMVTTSGSPDPMAHLFAPAVSPGLAPTVAISTPTAVESRLTPAVDGNPGRPFLAFDFYGDTPSLAWSPNSQHLAFNGAFQGAYYGDPTFRGSPEQLGVFVMDATASTVQRIDEEPRYHLAWADDDTVASACPYYIECTNGIALTNLNGATTRPVGSGVLNLAAAEGNRLTYFDGDIYSWARYDPSTGRTDTSVSSNCLWEPPAEEIVDQCVQQVGDVRVWAQVPTGLYVQVGEASPIRLDPSPPWIYELGYAWGCSRDDFNGPIQPCLSPDGSRVAYITRSMTGMSLHVHDIPRF